MSEIIEIRAYRRYHALMVLDERNQALGATDEMYCNQSLQRAVFDAWRVLQVQGWNREDFYAASALWGMWWKSSICASCTNTV
jgi:hypothetical protein